MPFDSDVTMRAARILTDQDPGPGDRLDAFLLLTGLEFLWRRDGPGAGDCGPPHQSACYAGSAHGRRNARGGRESMEAGNIMEKE